MSWIKPKDEVRDAPIGTKVCDMHDCMMRPLAFFATAWDVSVDDIKRTPLEVHEAMHMLGRRGMLGNYQNKILVVVESYPDVTDMIYIYDNAHAGRITVEWSQPVNGYTHDFDIVASVLSDHADFELVPASDIKDALLRRIHSLSEDEVKEAVGHVQTQEGDLT